MVLDVMTMSYKHDQLKNKNKYNDKIINLKFSKKFRKHESTEVTQ